MASAFVIKLLTSLDLSIYSLPAAQPSRSPRGARFSEGTGSRLARTRAGHRGGRRGPVPRSQRTAIQPTATAPIARAASAHTARSSGRGWWRRCAWVRCRRQCRSPLDRRARGAPTVKSRRNRGRAPDRAMARRSRAFAITCPAASRSDGPDVMITRTVRCRATSAAATSPNDAMGQRLKGLPALT